jgi:phage terminase small subunit
MVVETNPTSPSAGGKLTPKQEAFARAYLEIGNASAAYRRCYEVRETTKAETVWQSACRLLADPKVTARVTQLQAALRGRHDVTVDSLCAEFDESRKLAMATAQPAAANGATAGKARLLGLLSKSTAPVKTLTQATAKSDAEVARQMADLLKTSAC